MTQDCASDQLAIMGDIQTGRQERFFVMEIAKFIKVRDRDVVRWARNEGLLHSIVTRPNPSIGHYGYRRVNYLTAHGFCRAVIHFRALQSLTRAQRWPKSYVPSSEYRKRHEAREAAERAASSTPKLT